MFKDSSKTILCYGDSNTWGVIPKSIFRHPRSVRWPAVLQNLLGDDYEVISELTTFIQKHNSFEAEEGCNDDLAMCLVIFSWLVAQDYFKEMTDNDVRKRIYEEQKNQIEQDMAPFGFISDGLDEMMDIYVEPETGDRWMNISKNNLNEFHENWNTDEYGDRSYMWDYR